MTLGAERPLALEASRISPTELTRIALASDVRVEDAAESLGEHVLAPRAADRRGGRRTVDLGLTLATPPKGILQLVLRALPERTIVDHRTFLVSDLHLVAKHGALGETQVWALSARDAGWIAGVEIRAITAAGTEAAACTTGAEGHCELPARAGAAPAALTAVKGDDLAFIRLGRHEARRSSAAQGASELHGSVFGDRAVYAPGETVHVVGIVRGPTLKAPPAIPVELRLEAPEGRPVRQLLVRTNDAGLATIDFSIPPLAASGNYALVLTAGGTELDRTVLHVTDLRPPEFGIQFGARTAVFEGAAAAEFVVMARSLVGRLSGRLEAVLDCELAPLDTPAFTSKGLAFGDLRTPERTGPPLRVTALLGPDGRGTLACPVADVLTLGRPARVTAHLALRGGAGGGVHRRRAVAISSPRSRYLGLAPAQARRSRDGAVGVRGVILDREGRPVDADGPVTLELYRIDRGSDGMPARLVADARRSVRVEAGAFTASLRAARRADGYLVRATLGSARAEIVLPGEVADHRWLRAAASGDENGPTEPETIAIRIVRGKASDQGPEVTFVAPFSGRALLTYEAGNRITHAWKDVKTGTVSWRPAPQTPVGDLRATVYLVGPPAGNHGARGGLRRALGSGASGWPEDAGPRELTIKAPNTLLPGGNLDLVVDVNAAQAGSFVVVTVVDESLDSRALDQPRLPGEATLDGAPRAVATIDSAGLRIPADDEGGRAPRGELLDDIAGSPLAARRYADWSRVVRAGPDGRTVLRFALPRYQGRFRVGAVAFGNAWLGRGTTVVTTTDPLGLSARIPAVLRIGNEVEVPVSVSNPTSQEQTIEVELRADTLPDAVTDSADVVQIDGEARRPLKLAPRERRETSYRVRAVRPRGRVRFFASAQLGQTLSHFTVDTAARPAARGIVTWARFTVPSHELDLTKQLPGAGGRVGFWMTADPLASARSLASRVLLGSAGALEETAAAVWLRAALGTRLPFVAPLAAVDGKAGPGAVREGLERLLAMQTLDGGFAVFPSGVTADPGGSAFATHALVDLGKRGHRVHPARVDAALAYLETSAALAESGTEPAAAYAHYVLALAGRPAAEGARSLLARLKERPPGDGALEATALVEQAARLAGDPTAAATVAGRSPDAARARAVHLLAQGPEAFGGPAFVEEVASGALRADSLPSPSELVFALIGLEAARLPASKPSGTLVVDGKLREPHAEGDDGEKAWVLGTEAPGSKAVALIDPAAAPGTVLEMTSEAGPLPPDAATGPKDLRVAVVVRRLDGAALDPATLRLGEKLALDVEARRDGGATGARPVEVVLHLPASLDLVSVRPAPDEMRGLPEGGAALDDVTIFPDRVITRAALTPQGAVRFRILVRASFSGRSSGPVAEARLLPRQDTDVPARASSAPIVVAGDGE